jgi:hypothetical protein
VTCGSIDVLRLPRFRIDDLPAPEAPAQSCQAQLRTAILSRIERADQLEWPVRRGSLFKICVRYSDTERRYNEYPVPATSAHKGSNLQRDATLSIRSKDPVQNVSAFPGMAAPESHAFSKDHLVFENLAEDRFTCADPSHFTFLPRRFQLSCERFGNFARYQLARRRSGWKESGGS